MSKWYPRMSVRKVPATTNNLTNAIINFLISRGHYAFRVNNGAVFDTDKKVFRKSSTSRKGISDIICVLNPTGKILAVEVKNILTKDRASTEQNIFKNRVELCGGMHIFATSLDKFKEYYYTNIFE
jgi:hypothetical protein